MAAQLAIPCLFMRGGTSRGPYINAADLPEDREKISQILLDIMGRGGPPQPDGLGGTASVTNKAAILSVEDGIIQYLFAQIIPEEERVDFSPNCGNMLVAVGPAAIEMGLVPASPDKTIVDIINVNTGTRAQSVVLTPNGDVTYNGDATIDGVPGKAAPILVSFVNPAGAKTSGLLPTGKPIEEIDGHPVSLVDCAVPMIWARASDLGVSIPSDKPLDQNKDLMEKLESMRLEAGQRMGLGDCKGRVIPKMGLIAQPNQGGTISARYFTPYAQHPTFAFTGAVCAASLCQISGAIATDLLSTNGKALDEVVIEHPSGKLAISIETKPGDDHIEIVKAGAIRTARLIMRGEVFAKSHIN